MANYNPYNQQPPVYNPPHYQYVPGIEPPQGYVQKSRVVAGIFGILLGSMGIHNFYLGNSSKALAQLLIATLGSAFTCGVSTVAVTIWGIIEGVKILDGRIATDGNGVFLKD